ncbi:MAG: hypothetical protein IPK19_37475 [Chloroflexi bacterium]|nr:hypothetical protein [Chloroflexota bacterium]
MAALQRERRQPIRRTLQLSILRAVLDATGQPPIQTHARLATVSDVVRVVVHYFDGRSRDSVGTLFCTRTGAYVELRYRDALTGRPLTYPLPETRPSLLLTALRSAGFDKLGDQDPLPKYDASDVWMVERAAGAFAHGLVVAPDLAEVGYAEIVRAIQQHLPEVLRPLR